MRPPLLRAYGLAARLGQPLIQRRLAQRLAAQGVAPERLAERAGRATLPRPEGPLIWFHAASLGESLSILPLIEALRGEYRILVTTGTASSAEVLARRLPEGVLHQFAPFDGPPVTRFLSHWRPALAVFVESEIWPLTLEACARAGVPRALIGARLSARSLRGWGRFPRSAAHVLGQFDMIAAQDAATRDGLAALGARQVRLAGNLKSAAAPPPVDAAELARLRGALGRPVWCASSTHEGEDAPVLEAHLHLLRDRPDLLLILAPRHPERAEAIAALAHERGLTTARRSEGDPGAAQVWIADTLGEMGLWYSLSPITFLAGSWGEAGGHNPFEPASLGAAILAGPKVPNAAQAYAALEAAGALETVEDAQALADAVAALLDAPEVLRQRGAAARGAARQGDALIAELAASLHALAEGKTA
ncbi:3-deoxy-D-manno-octulosonic acid transferase [Pseudoroseicyclus aestuarii]|uniref:3-deoxy-D-manno-octulosonic acid transferase n=1 Tax=Pseudoroseicyclus aestuarii TaxID=1795041 RepID=A0A318STV2_9RHOB|nr:glycosyltransferase N-terminal domain-containing protein [Pseudoroseicyclus aestuarii]PYE85391.1 3-deoxy-D-manno-octulosonic-acid transferase [Pseudoroseicyclus aestuarii]